MLAELSVKKLSHVAFVEVKAKHFEDNYKELCLMIDYMIKDSYSIRLESLDIDGRFQACFSSDKLEEIVKNLESGNIPLDDAIDSFNEAMKLAKKCDERLKNAEEKVNKILTEEGKLEDFEVSEQ